MAEQGNLRIYRIFRLLAFAAFFTTLVIYSPNVMVIQGFDSADYTGYFAEPSLITAFIVAIVIVVLAFLVPRLSYRSGVIRATSLVGGLLYLIGVTVYVTVTFAQADSAVTLNRIAAVCAGIGIIPICIAWAYTFHDLDLPRAIFIVAVAGGLSALCNTALSNATSTVAETIFLVLLFVGVIWPAVEVLRAKRSDIEDNAATGSVSSSEPYPRPNEAISDTPSASVPPMKRLNVRAFLSVLGLSLLGMIIASFAMGVQPMKLFDNTVDAQRAGMVIGAVALLPLVFFNKNRPLYSFIYQIYLPVIAVIAIVLCAFPADTVMREVALLAVYTFFIMVCGVAIATAIAAANAREFSRPIVFATLVGVFSGTGILGIFLGGQIDTLIDNHAAVLVILTVLYGGGLLLVSCVRSWRLTVSTTDKAELVPDEPSRGIDAAGDQTAETFEERVGRLAAENGLSPRETQIVSYIGRGHSSVYVAKTLLISESTVYSHVRNIYRKLGISSREELIQLLNETGGSDDSGAVK